MSPLSEDQVNPSVSSDFEVFCDEVRPRLVRALIAALGTERASDGAAEALLYAWEHWAEVSAMASPVAFLFRVGQSRSRRRRRPPFEPSPPVAIPDVEPELLPALLELPLTQRTAVWLVHGCGWTYGEVAEALGSSTTAVGTHLQRGMKRLRSRLGVTE
jgi:DNA-directed RNA polymerase specialized sigma24 family protein